YSEGNEPVRHRVESKILELLGQNNEISITVMTVAGKDQHDVCKTYMDDLSTLFTDIEVETKVVEADNTTYAILDESQKNNDLMVLGAIETKDRKSQLYNPVVDGLVRMSACPTIVVQANHLGDSWEPRRVLGPTNGTVEAKNAAELSFYIS